MKKIFSVLLAVIMVFSISATAFAADFVDTAENTHYEAIETLHALGLVDGYNATTFGPNDELTRAQACKIIVTAVNGTPRDYYNQIFTDVPVTHWAFDYIVEAYNMGFINGYGNNIFGPEDKVTYDQVTKIILNVLGYRNTGSWPTGLREMASKAGLYNNCVIIDGSAPCTRGVVAQMIYNAFNCMTLDANGFPTGKTFLFALGFKVIDPSWQVIDNKFTGHQVETYKKGTAVITTSDIITYGYTAKYVDDDTVKIGSKAYDIDWTKVTYFVDGIQQYEVSAMKNAAAIEVIYNANNDMIAVSVTSPVKVQLFKVGELELWIPQAEIDEIDGYIKGISTVTKVGDEYIVSNNYYIGYVVDTWNTASNYWAQFSDGKIMKFDNTWSFNSSKIVIIFYDYNGNAVSYQCM